MPTERLVIEVTETGARIVTRSLEGVGKAAAGAAPQISLLQKALATLGIGFSIREAIRLTDAYTDLQNQIRLVTQDQAQFSLALAQVGEIGRRSSVPIEQTAAAFGRLSRVTQRFGLDQRETTKVVKNLVNALEASGTSSEEASGALSFFSRILADGAVEGREFVFILSRVPVLADLMANRLGVTTTSLKRMAVQGQITGRDILKTLRDVGPEIDEQLRKKIDTAGNALVSLRNALVLDIGRISELAGVGGGLVTIIKFLSENTFVLTGLLAGLALTQIPRLTVALALLGRRLLTAVGGPVLLGVGLLIGKFVELRLEAKDNVSAMKGLAVSLQGLILFVVKFGAIAVGTFEGMADAAIRAAEKIKDFVTLADPRRQIARSRALTASFGPGEGRPQIGAPEATQAGLSIGDAFSKAFNARVEESVGAATKFLEEFRTDLEKQAAESATAATTADTARKQANEEELDFFQRKKEFLDAFITQRNKEIEQQEFVNQLFAEGAITQTEFVALLKQTGAETETLAGGLAVLRQHFLDIDTSVGAIAKGIGEALTGAIDRISDALADFAVSGFRDIESLKKALSDLLLDLGKQIIALIIKMAILRTLEAALGGGGGGVVGAAVSAIEGGGAAAAGLQAGGPVRRGVPRIVGERGRELFVPQQTGNIVPASQVQGTPEVNVSVINVTDPDEVTSAINAPAGEQAILNVINRNSRAVRRILG